MRYEAPTILVLIAATMAGCAEPAVPVVASSQAVDAGTVAGRVLNDQLLPVPEAEVGIVGTNRSGVTDAAGAFVLIDVPAGTHEVVATKVGYEPARKRVHVAAGQALTGVELGLVEIPPPAEPFVDAKVVEGYVACAVNIVDFTFPLFQFCEADPNHDPIFEFDAEGGRGLVSVVLELVWTPSTAATGTRLREELWHTPNCDGSVCAPTEIYGRVNGRSPLKSVYGSLATPIDRINAEGPTRLGAAVLVPRDATTYADAVVAQPVTHYVSLFYNSEPGPAYTLTPGGA